MGLLDTLGGLAGQPGSTQDNPRAALIQAVLGMLTRGNAPGAVETDSGGAGGFGGLAGLLQRFEGAGMGDAVASWIGSGSNLPVSADQIRAALGSDALKTLAEHAGLPEGDAASHLSSLLPQMVDKLTPNGALPAEGVHEGGLAGAMQMLGGLFGQGRV